MTLLSWIAPPVVGAAIGFITNDIAIRMLFRPLREYRILGIRVPFTPGIIPRKRHALANAMGRMVSQELITAENVTTHLRQESTREGFRAWVSGSTSRVLDCPLAELGARSGLGAELGSFALEALEGLFSSPSLASMVESAVVSAIESLGDASVESLIGEDAARRVAQALLRAVSDRSTGGLPLSDEAIAAAARAVGAAARPAGRVVQEWLAAPEVRPELERRAQELLRAALDKLSVLQKIIVRAGQYDRRLEERLPEIVDDALREIDGLLAERATWEALGEAVRGNLTRSREQSAPEGGAESRGLPAEAREALEDLVAALVRPLLARPIRDTAEGALGVDREGLARAITDRIVGAARRPGAARELAERVRRAVGDSLAGSTVTVGGLLGIGEHAKKQLDDALAARALDLVHAKLPELLGSFDVRRMVVERIDALDVAAVEKLLLIVIAEHLKWINVFGAILGAIIGFGQVLLGVFL